MPPLRFVVLEHAGTPTYKPGTHWDLMLEWQGRLRTWELPTPPASGKTIVGRALADHRLEYLSYEGPVSGERGTVRRWDAGEYELISETPFELVVRLDGGRLRGTLRMTQDPAQGETWTIVFQAAG